MNQKGFTLVEILVTILILAVVALSIMALLPQGYRQVTDGGRMSVMTHLAYEKLEELKNLSYGDDDLTVGVHPSNPAKYRLAPPDYAEDFNGYSLKWTVAQPETGLKTVTMEVGYMLYEPDGTKIAEEDQKFQLEEMFITYVTQ